MFKVLTELINLREDDDNILSGVEKLAGNMKTGYNAAKANQKDAEAKNKAASAAQKDGRSADLQTKINVFLKQYFTRFPDLSPKASSMLDNIQSRADALTLFKAFKGLAADLDKMRDGINKAAGPKMEKATLQRAISTADGLAESNNINAVRSSIKDFVRKESSFFSRLVSVDSNFDLKDADFKDLLSRKINATPDHRFGDAVAALNILLAWISHDLTIAAQAVRDKGMNFPAPEKN
jgi:hypothetical protein